MPSPIRLVALDLDGTLVGEDLVLRPRVRDAVAQAQARGVAVTIVTGRMFAAARPFARALSVAGPMVCYQGAAIFDAASGAVLRQTPVHQNVTRETLRWAHEHGYRSMTTDWRASNLLSSRFWPRRGFRPQYLRLSRVVS